MNNSHEWISLILDKLFQAEDRRINNMIEELNRKNSVLKKKNLFGFMHMGNRYIPESCKMQAAILNKKEPMTTLSFELIAEASGLIADMNKSKADEDQIKQVLFKLLYQAKTLQDVRDCLPECLVSLVPDVSKLKRTVDDPTYFIRNDERALKQYRKMLPKIEMYAMSHMIY